MKKCTHCGKEYPDGVLVCEHDAWPLMDPNAPNSPRAPHNVGIIEPIGHNLACSVCRSPIDRDLDRPGKLLITGQNTACPQFCSVCNNWFHPSCLPKSCVSGDEFHCPKCAEKPKLVGAGFYCQSCAGSTPVKSDSIWPNFICTKCNKPVSLAAKYFAGGAEVRWLIAIGVLSLAVFIGSLTAGAPQIVY